MTCSTVLAVLYCTCLVLISHLHGFCKVQVLYKTGSVRALTSHPCPPSTVLYFGHTSSEAWENAASYSTPLKASALHISSPRLTASHLHCCATITFGVVVTYFEPINLLGLLASQREYCRHCSAMCLPALHVESDQVTPQRLVRIL